MTMFRSIVFGALVGVFVEGTTSDWTWWVGIVLLNVLFHYHASRAMFDKP